MSIYDFKVKKQDGTEVSLADYKGKVLLIVNTAITCKYTPQYVGLQKLYEKYKERNFEILDFPCNQFGYHAPGTEDEIAAFCNSKFGITFKQFAKIDVNGDDAESIFKYLKRQKGGIFNDDIKWNFTKFLIDKEGNVVRRFGSRVTPEKIEKYIQKLL